LIIELGAIYIMDRGYLDFARLYKIHQASAFFVTRTKLNFSRIRLYSQPVDKAHSSYAPIVKKEVLIN